MRRIKLIVSLFMLLTATPILAQQNITLQLPDTLGVSEDTLCLDIKTSQFDGIVSLQFSLNWDATVIRYLSFVETDLSFIALGSANAANGRLRFSWFDIQGNGQSLPDGSSIVQLKFLVIGSPGDATDINFTDDPLEIQVFRATGTPNDFQEVDLNAESGRVTVGGGSPFAAFGVNNVTCFGNGDGSITTTLVGLSTETIRWTGPAGFQSSESTIRDLSPGNYTFEIVGGNGEVIFDSTLVISQPEIALQVTDIATTNAACAAPTGSAVISVSGGTAPYRFDIGDGFTNTNEFSNLAPDTYNLTLRDTNDCEVMADFTIGSADAPELSLPDTVFLCPGENILLDAGDFANYLWSNGQTTRTISVNQLGAFSVIVSDIPDCTTSDTVQVVAGGAVDAAIEAETTAICPGDSIQLVARGGDMFQWQDDSGTLSATDIANPFASPTAETTYFVEVSNGCNSGKDSILIQVYEVTSTAGLDTCIGPGEEIALNASGGLTYFWFASQYPVSDNDIPNPTVSPEDSTDYFVMITDANGCENLDTVTVLVANNPLDILAINMITPNGDGKNDALDFGNISKYGVNSLKIYNRWGDLIYNKVNYQRDDERFDGTYKGKELPTGNYFYVLAFTNGEIKQTLTILRE